MLNIKIFLWIAIAIASTVWSMDPANKADTSSAASPVSSGLQSSINTRNWPSPHPHGLSPVGMELKTHFHTSGIEEHMRPNLRWANLRDKASDMKGIIKNPETKEHKKVGKDVLQQVHSDMKIYKSHNYLPAEVTDKMIDKHGKRPKSLWKKLTRSRST
ncbi:uncharacterized protein FA14DRAFT_183289 [Meira miltonrushii]|uniref:Uncharacterized protein n=1 Tax=Meira miltonrushii TaxID=1280837 RepID=A0A316VIS9_9BASI|nr:uncharacterized protein FA14DRAFT_183289 [Meira miltonrushii]PWN36968.1 hypothetical protein FA14DRAFT_183289 [Meira miltonrushii]